MQTIQILTRWLHYFTFCLTLSLPNSKETLNTLIKLIISKRPTGVNIGVAVPAQVAQPSSTAGGPASAASKISTPSQTTPTFRSPHSSFSDGLKNQSASVSKLKTLLVGAEEYETYDEELSNSFFANLIQKNFHQQIFAFVNQTQKCKSMLGLGKNDDFGAIFQLENEGILLNLLEILMVLNDVK